VSSAASELESMAIRNAKEATRLDQQGSKGLAITYYQKAIDAFLKMVNLYPSYELNKIYVQRAMMYQERIKVLQVGACAETADEDYATPDFRPLGRADQPAKGEPQALGKTMETATPPKKSGYDDLLVVEKPSIGWEDVSGLDDVKRSMKEP